MDAAVTELAVVEIRLLGTLTGEFGDASHRLALTLTLLNLVLQNLSHILVDMEIVVYFLLQEIAHILIDGFATIRRHRSTSELNLGLTLEDRFFYVDGNGSHQSVSYVCILILAVELLDSLGNMLLEGTLMRTSLGGVLTVDEGIILLAILVSMGEGNLDVLALHVDDVVETFVGHIIAQQILQTMAAQDTAAIVHDGESGVQISIVAEHRFHEIIVEGIVLEQGIIRLEEDKGTVLVLSIFHRVALQNTFLKLQMAHLSVAVRLYFEVGTEGIDRLHTHTVQTDALLERLAVVLTTGIQHTYSLNELALRNTTTIVAHADTQIVLDIDFQTGTCTHLEFIDRVVYHLLQEHINTIFRQISISQTADVHTRTGTHMLHIAQVADVIIGIFYRLLLLRGIGKLISGIQFAVT